jgi:branched-chain amino acid transport system permease protein
MNRGFLALCVIVIVVGLFSPSDFYTNFATRVLIASILALSLNLLVGEAGLMSLGHSSFAGVAAYCVAWSITQQGFGHVEAIVFALLGATITAAVYGLLALRAQGIGFLMITLALGQITWGLAQRWVEVTGGENGITGLKRPAPFGIALDGATRFYVLTAIVFLVVCYVLSRLVRSPFGASLRGTRDQPRRMSALGYNVWLIRWLAFIVAGSLAGVAGILDVYYNKFASPNVLSLMESAIVLLMVIVGGSATLYGPVLGATIVLLFTQIASSYVERWVGLLGVLFLAVVLFMPDGVLPWLQRFLNGIRMRADRDEGSNEATQITTRRE